MNFSNNSMKFALYAHKTKFYLPSIQGPEIRDIRRWNYWTFLGCDGSSLVVRILHASIPGRNRVNPTIRERD